tara:strand:+ start:4849 stop:5142 length:294 start_codon:yes stop_codon:yes gene_type:complete
VVEKDENFIRGIRKDVDALYQSHEILRQAHVVVDILPKGKARNKIIKQVHTLRKELIKLDVVCQDIEWSMTARNLQQQNNFSETFDFNSNTTTANTN